VRELVREIVKADFLDSRYMSKEAFDAPVTTLRVEMGGRSNEIKGRSGQNRLELLKARIDQIVDSNQWIGDGR
jgi:hypothetical protein